MGVQTSSLDCKQNLNKERQEQVVLNRQFFSCRRKLSQPESLRQPGMNNFFSQKIISNNNILSTQVVTQNSQGNGPQTLSVISPKHAAEQKVFIPDHEAITRVAESPFRRGTKQKQYYFEDKASNLAQIVQPRYNSQKHFPYSQVLSLTESLVYGLAYMSRKQCNHHDFYLTNIYYIEGKFKIINPIELDFSGFHLTCQRSRFSFLSPQLIMAISEEVLQNSLGEEIMNKSDIFAIGMILLEVCSLQPSSQCYDEQSYNLVDSVIRDRLAKVVNVYSPAMAQCINIMLKYEFQTRIDPITLAQLVHSKIQNEKNLAAQMQAPKMSSLPTHQSSSNIQGPRMIHPNPNVPQQLLKGFPQGPPPPYMHQSFKMQNLNQNVIAVSLPNQQFTRIGPNNQGFLSPSSLQQKLKVIELIKEQIKQDEEQQQEKDFQQNLSIKQKNQPVQLINSNKKLESIKPFQQKEQKKPEYPFAESIYREKPFNDDTIYQTSLQTAQQVYNKQPTYLDFRNQTPQTFVNNQFPYRPYESQIRKPNQDVRTQFLQQFDRKRTLAHENKGCIQKVTVIEQILAEIPKIQVLDQNSQLIGNGERNSIHLSSRSEQMGKYQFQEKRSEKEQGNSPISSGVKAMKNMPTINSIYPASNFFSFKSYSEDKQQYQPSASTTHESLPKLSKKYGAPFDNGTKDLNVSQIQVRTPDDHQTSNPLLQLNTAIRTFCKDCIKVQKRRSSP